MVESIYNSIKNGKNRCRVNSWTYLNSDSVFSKIAEYVLMHYEKALLHPYLSFKNKL